MVDGDIEETNILTSKCRCPDGDIVIHCWNAGNLYGKESCYLGDVEQTWERLDIRETDTLTSKCRSSDVI